MTSNEKLDKLVYEIIHGEDDGFGVEDLDIYKEILNDLEILEILKSRLLAIKYSLNNKEYRKVKEWLEND